MNINETKDDFEVEVAASGLKKKDFRIEPDMGVLTSRYGGGWQDRG